MFDWKNINLGALVKSNIMRGLVLAAVGLVVAKTGQSMTPDMTNQINTIVTDLGDLLIMAGIGTAGHQRAVAQPENLAVIVPKKDPDPSKG